MRHKFQFPTRLESKMISRPSAVQVSLVITPRSAISIFSPSPVPDVTEVR